MTDFPAGFDLKALRVFHAVVEAGGMTPAAQRLGMTQSGVSQTIAALEQAVGANLFDRSLRPIALTGAGTVLMERSRTLLEEAGGALSALRDLDQRPRDCVTIAMAESMAGTTGPLLVRRLGPLADHWRIWSGISPDHHAALLSRAVDHVVSAGDELDGLDGLIRHDLVSEPFVVVLPKRERLPDGAFPDPGRLPFIRYTLRSTIGRQIERQVSRLGLDLPNRMEFDTATGQLAAVADGMGWCLTTPLCLIQEAHRLEQLQVLPMPRGAFTRTMALFGRSDDPGDLTERIAGELKSILSETIRPRLTTAMPFAGEQFTVARD
ncbi:LysR family transcriptional regulator [Amorphus coralli]|uniref:LysR family transcriptional regulator n=1 Tax=Amorphus coralli TaxID=340680 RepID=UPI000371C5D2|nr:LysR family transcriptional regulator [Amorphus coralli]